MFIHLGNKDHKMDQFKTLTRLYFQLLLAIHHYISAEKQTKCNFSKAFSNQIRLLNKFVKPAKPNTLIQEGINNVNTNWAIDMNHMLMQHYVKTINQTLQDIEKIKLNKDNHNKAKNIAKSWAKKKLQQKLNQTTSIHGKLHSSRQN